MKKYRWVLKYFLTGIIFLATQDLVAQKWSDLSDEEKLMKAKAFREDNQAYLKNTLKMTDDQMVDIDNVNICFLSTLDRIDRYGKSDADKEKYAKTVANARSAQLDVIMGADNHKKYREYIAEKLKKAKVDVGM